MVRMKYSFQCVASEVQTDRMLDHIYFLNHKHNQYQLYENSFTMYTHLSKANVQGRIYIYSLHELIVPDLIHDIPTVVLIIDIHKNEKGYNMLQLWSVYCNKHKIPFYFRKEERELMDELYVKAFSWLISSINSKLSILKQQLNNIDSVHHYLNIYHGDKADYLKKRYIYSKDKALTVQNTYWFNKAYLSHLAFYSPIFVK